MGGHDHHHVKLPPVPDPSIYKVEDYPELQEVQNRLAKHGLKDPWLRNCVWRVKNRYTVPKNRRNSIFLDLHLRNWKIWVPLVGFTIALEQFLGIDYHAHSPSHGDEHGKHH